MDKSTRFQKYLLDVELGTGTFVRVAGIRYPPESINPSGDNRYGPAVYLSSGVSTAISEVGSKNLTGKKIFPTNSGVYRVFDQRRYCEDFPDEAPKLMASKESGGYDYCREFKEALIADSEGTISGIMYASVPVSGGVNLALWDPQDPDGLHSGFFREGLQIDMLAPEQSGESERTAGEGYENEPEGPEECP